MTTTDLKGSKKAVPKPEPTNGHAPFTTRHSVAGLREKAARVRFEYDAEPYEASYNRHAITVGFNRSMDQRESQTEGERIVWMLAELLLDWDLIDAAGAPLPPSAEELEKLPIPFLARLLSAIFEDFSPPATPDADSGSSF